MSSLAIVILVVVLVVALLLASGLLVTRRRDERDAGAYRRHLLEADEALERARAADKGWDRDVLDRAAREALERERPGWRFDELHLILVDDREGVADDRAHLVAMGREGETRVILARRHGHWDAEQVEATG
jgi:hypothetical protein